VGAEADVAQQVEPLRDVLQVGEDLRLARVLAAPRPWCSSGVRITPGQVALTRTRCAAGSTATDRLRLITAAFAEE
jgi:hypothetical protein